MVQEGLAKANSIMALPHWLPHWLPHRKTPRPASYMSTLRAALHCSTVEAVFATVHVALTQGIFLTNYLIDMGASNFTCGVVEALPFLTQVLFLFAPVLVRRLNRRKPVVLVLALAHRMAWLALIAFMFFDWPPVVRHSLIVLVLLLGNGCAVIAGNAWLGWMADLVPASIRGAYYGRRNVYLGMTSLIAILIGSHVLTFAGQWGDRRIGYTICFGTAVASAFFSAWMLSRQHEPPLTPLVRWTWLQLWVEPLKNTRFRRYLLFMTIWQFSLGLAAAFFGVHMVRVLKMTPTQMGMQALVGSTIALATTRLWARPLDRLGSKAVLVTSGVLVALHVWIWFGARQGFLWPVWLTVIVGGFAWSGFNLATFNWPQLMTKPDQRQYALGLLGSVSGATFVVASLLGGTLTTVLPTTLLRIGQFEFLHYHLLFALSALGRLVAVLALASRVPADPGRFQASGPALFRETLRCVLVINRTTPRSGSQA